MSTYLLLALAVAAIVGVATARLMRQRRRRISGASTTMLSIDELADLLARDAARVVDVRTRADFDGEQGHIPGAVNLPLEELTTRMAELGSNREQTIALICRTDRKSAAAAALLTDHGFKGAKAVRGGMTAWRERGFPTANDLIKN